ncbi:hypothetical protein HKCCSP123_12105 [Rhodobacterales bacterium HKCCSP123]|nr:hypothetical protein [Rhodobacterales bacterium HKCCSP123]
MADILGLVAGLLVLATFNARDFLMLRVLASASNLAFILYGTLLSLWPVAGLHAILLPINLWHLRRLLRDRKRMTGTLPPLPPLEDRAHLRRRDARHPLRTPAHQ